MWQAGNGLEEHRLWSPTPGGGAEPTLLVSLLEMLMLVAQAPHFEIQWSRSRDRRKRKVGTYQLRSRAKAPEWHLRADVQVHPGCGMSQFSILLGQLLTCLAGLLFMSLLVRLLEYGGGAQSQLAVGDTLWHMT
jgi:hypothetical protein